MDGWMEPSVHLIMFMIRADWSTSKDIGPGLAEQIPVAAMGYLLLGVYIT